MADQKRVRLTGHLIEGCVDIQEKKSLRETTDVYRTAVRFTLLSPDLQGPVMALAKESPVVQSIVDEMILEQYKTGIPIKPLSHKAWIDGKIIEARARAAKETDKYFIIIGERKLGPHRLDLLRQLVAQDVLDEGLLVQPEKGSRATPLGFMPEFWDFPPDVVRRVEEIRKKQRSQPIEAPTPKQMLKLDFFQIPFPIAGMTRVRASEFLDAFMILDPETETCYHKGKGP